MRRRDFMAALAGAAAWPAVAHAQQPTRLRRIGIGVVGAPPPARDLELVRELARLGWVRGGTAAYIVAGQGDPDQLPQTARTVLATEPEVIIGAGVPLIDTVIGMTDTIPIVMTATGDPIAIGYTASMARPTRNITGFALSSPSLVAKRLEILRELLPGVRKVGHIWAPGRPIAQNLDEEARMAAPALGLGLAALPLDSGADIPS